MPLPEWDEITTTPEWNSLQPDQRHRVFRGYLSDLKQLPEWNSLQPDQKFKVVDRMQVDGKMQIPVEEPSFVKDVIGGTAGDIVSPFKAQTYKAAEALNLGIAGFSQRLDDISQYISDKTGFNKGGIFGKASKTYAENADYWDKRAQQVGTNVVDEIVGSAIGGAVPGIAEFMLNVPYAVLTGAAEAHKKGKSELVGAATEGARRFTLGQMFHAAGTLKQPLSTLAMSGTMAAETAAVGGTPADIAKSAGIGALYGITTPGGNIGIREIKESILPAPKPIPEGVGREMKVPPTQPLAEELKRPPMPLEEKINAITKGEAVDRLAQGDKTVIEHIKEGVQNKGPEVIADEIYNKALGKAVIDKTLPEFQKIEPAIKGLIGGEGQSTIAPVAPDKEGRLILPIGQRIEATVDSSVYGITKGDIGTIVKVTKKGYEIDWDKGMGSKDVYAGIKPAGPSTTAPEPAGQVITPPTPEFTLTAEKAPETKPIPTQQTLVNVQPQFPNKTGGRVWSNEKDLMSDEMVSQIKGFPGTADVGGYKLTSPTAIELPEIVELAKDIGEGKYPLVKTKLRAFHGQALGVFKGKEGIDKQSIELKADIFATPGLAERVLAHEIGHLVDWLPDSTLKRGNVIGHVAALKKYLKHTFELMKKPEIMTELKALTQKWKPFTEGTTGAEKRFTKYRYSPTELYADAISVLVNDPALLKATAPKFHEAFFEYLDKRPSVKAIYEKIQENVGKGSAEIFQARDERLNKMFEKAEEVYAKPILEKQSQTIRDRAAKFVVKAKKELVDTSAPLYDAIKNPIARHEVRKRMEDYIYRSAEGEAYFREQFEKALKPFVEAGIPEVEVGKYFYLRRVINERSALANPEGFTAKTAQDHLAGMRIHLGDEKMNLIEQTAIRFWEVRKTEVISRLKETNLFDKELMSKIENNEFYATFDVVKHMEERYGRGVGAKIYKQIGTLEGISNPLTATLAKDISLLNAINRKMAIKESVEALLKEGYTDILPAETRWNGKYQEIIESRDPSKSTLVYLENGKTVGYYVPKDIATSFESNPVASWLTTRFLAATARPFKEVFVSKRPGFFPFNAIRDINAAIMKLPEASATRLLPLWVKSIPPSVRGLREYDPDIQQLYKMKALITSVDRTGETALDTQFERMLIRHGLKEARGGKVGEAVQNFLNKIQFIGEVAEQNTKRASFEYLKKYHPEMPRDEMAHLVRWSGSPAFLIKGEATPLTNNILLFSNPMIQGWRTQGETAKATPAEYVWKRAKYTYMPKLLMWAGATGLLGEGIRQIYLRASEYDKVNYFVIPLGETPNGKAVYLRIPQDETGRVLGGTFWKLLNGIESPQDALALFDYTAGQLPGLNPAISIAMDVVDYASGRNPYDSFRGIKAIPQQVFEAQDRRSIEAFAKYISNRAGLGIVYKFETDDVGRIKTELEKILSYPIVSDIIGRFIKVSDAGLSRELREPVELVRRDKARISLDAYEGLINVINGKPLTDNQQMALETKALDKTLDSKVKELLVKKYGDAFTRAVFSAQSLEERIAIIKKMSEVNPEYFK